MARQAREPKPLRFLSLCSGIGGIDLAAEWAGMEIVGQVEIDPYCRKVLAKHWPDVKRVGDVRKVWGYDFGSVDVIGAGFPCQPASVAGQRRGAADTRWLWPEVLRVIQVYEPAWVVLENVPGLISLGLDDVLNDLDAAGYEAWPLVFPAAAIGAPHLRERIFVVAHANQHSGRWQERTRAGDVEGTARADAPREGHPQWYPAECGGEDVAHTHGERQRQPQGCQSDERRWIAYGSEDVGHANGPGPQGQEWSESSVRRDTIRQSTWQAEPRMGGEPDGLSRRVDSTGCPRHPWPVGPGQPQAPWEAPRTVTGTIPDRAARLKALGNAVVPQQVYPILAAIVAADEATSHREIRER